MSDLVETPFFLHKHILLVGNDKMGIVSQVLFFCLFRFINKLNVKPTHFTYIAIVKMLDIFCYNIFSFINDDRFNLSVKNTLLKLSTLEGLLILSDNLCAWGKFLQFSIVQCVKKMD